VEDDTSVFGANKPVRDRLPTHDDGRHCELRTVLDRIGDKWSVLVIVLLTEGPARYSELQRALPGISQRMLTLTLRTLERDGMVQRTVYPQVPPRVDYRLSPLGLTLLGPVTALAAWIDEHGDEVLRARAAFDTRATPSVEPG
jgi:DNA-binding HxlR family transcriptional regulator